MWAAFFVPLATAFAVYLVVFEATGVVVDPEVPFWCGLMTVNHRIRKTIPKTKRVIPAMIAMKTGLLVNQRALSFAPSPGSGIEVGTDDMDYLIQIIINKNK